MSAFGFILPPAITVTVNSTGDTSDVRFGDGVCADSNGNCTLRAAIQEATAYLSRSANNVQFNIPTTDRFYDPSTASWTINIGFSLPDVTGSVNINGPGANKIIVRNSIGYGGVAYVLNVMTNGTVNISGLQIGSSSYGEPSAGGIKNSSSSGTVNLTNCTISDNVFHDSYNSKGAGIYNISGTVNVTGSTIRNNAVALGEFGGGVANDSGTVNITNSRLVNNSSLGGEGGGLYNGTSGTVTITNSELSGNLATPIVSSDGRFSTGGSGGAVANFGHFNITSSTIAGNVASNVVFGQGGGGVLNGYRGSLVISNCTVTSNSVFGTSAAGGGIWNGGGTVSIKSSIIAQNNSTGSAPDVTGEFISYGFNLIGKKDGSTGFTAATDKTGTAKSPLNPKLDWKGLWNNGGPTQTIALMTGSPAIDAGSSVALTGTLTTDQRGSGFARIVDKTPANAAGGDGTDIGAYELR